MSADEPTSAASNSASSSAGELTGNSTAVAPPVGILAGSGSVPAEVAREIIARGGCVHIVPIDREPDARLAQYGSPARPFAWGQLGAILKSLKTAGCREVVFVGGVNRPDLAKLWPDAGLLWHAPRLLAFVAAGGDDGLIRKCIRFVEAQGFEVVGIADVAPGLLVPAGALGLEAPGPSAMADILLASSVVRALGRHDIGQAVIVADGVIEAIEGAEGTDRMLDRVAAQRARTGPRSDGLRGVLVKRPKPGQEMRIDMPAIGPRTVERAKAAGLAGLAVLAGATLAADREDLVAMADREGLYVYGFTEGDPSGATRPGLHRSGVHGPGVQGSAAHGSASPPVSSSSANAGAHTVAPITAAGTPSPRRMFASASLSRSDLADACAGAAALESLAVLGPSGSAVVVNGYVIGIEPGANARDLVDRTRTIRPWGIARWRRRAGVVIVNHAVADAAALVAAAVEAHLAAIAICSGTGRRDGTSEGQLAALAAGTGIAVVRMTPRPPG